MKSIFSSPFKSSHLPKILFAAANTEHLEFNVVVIPALKNDQNFKFKLAIEIF
jgi:hypothetical protein